MFRYEENSIYPVQIFPGCGQVAHDAGRRLLGVVGEEHRHDAGEKLLFKVFGFQVPLPQQDRGYVVSAQIKYKLLFSSIQHARANTIFEVLYIAKPRLTLYYHQIHSAFHVFTPRISERLT